MQILVNLKWVNCFRYFTKKIIELKKEFLPAEHTPIKLKGATLNLKVSPYSKIKS